jgi:hypothetical protein
MYEIPLIAGKNNKLNIQKMAFLVLLYILVISLYPREVIIYFRRVYCSLVMFLYVSVGI